MNSESKEKWLKYGGIAVGITTAGTFLLNELLGFIETSYDIEKEGLVKEIRTLKNNEYKEELLTELGISKATQAAMKTEEILIDVVNKVKEKYDDAQEKGNTDEMLQYYKILSQASRDLAEIYGSSRG